MLIRGVHAGNRRIGDSAVHQRAGAVVGEQLEQHRVRHLAVEDDDAFDALFERVDAGLDLGDHAAGNGAVGDQRAARRRPTDP